MVLKRESNLRQTLFRSRRVNYSSVPKCTIDIPLCFDIQANHRERLRVSLIIHREGGEIVYKNIFRPTKYRKLRVFLLRFAAWDALIVR